MEESHGTGSSRQKLVTAAGAAPVGLLQRGKPLGVLNRELVC